MLDKEQSRLVLKKEYDDDDDDEVSLTCLKTYLYMIRRISAF